MTGLVENQCKKIFLKDRVEHFFGFKESYRKQMQCLKQLDDHWKQQQKSIIKDV